MITQQYEVSQKYAMWKDYRKGYILSGNFSV